MAARPYFGWPFGGWRDPFEELDRVRRRLEGAAPGGWELPATRTAGVFPLVNVTEDAEAYHLRAELPGVIAKDLSITVTGRTVALSGERKIEAEPGASYHRRERRSGTFDRTLTLPGEVDSAKVDATLRQGVLALTLPKAQAAKPHQIQVKA